MGKFCNVGKRPVNKGLAVLQMSVSQWRAVKYGYARVSTDVLPFAEPTPRKKPNVLLGWETDRVIEIANPGVNGNQVCLP
jgi:hypothetical protein